MIRTDSLGRVSGDPQDWWAITALVQRAVREQARRDGGGFSRVALDLLNAAGEAARAQQVPFPEPLPAPERTMGLTVQEAAARRGCSESMIRRMARNGQLPAIRAGHQWIIPEDAVAPPPEP
ncbi:helix-turn-helix domain-containing protein [Arthrobacter horti]|uniref:helix-turn-helix domain-containing protein n=2 Tax=Arthrobacter TaxID=1663 RepID=UPI00345F67F0